MRGTGQLRAKEIGAVHQESDFFVGALVDALEPPPDLSLAFDSAGLAPPDLLSLDLLSLDLLSLDLLSLDLLSLDLLSDDLLSDDLASTLFDSLGLDSPDLSPLFDSPSDESRFLPELAGSGAMPRCAFFP
jgi:hypothetical protein